MNAQTIKSDFVENDITEKIKILLVDDHALFRSGLVYLLAGLGQEIDVIQASSHQEAIDMCVAAPNLVLLDYHLRGSSGNFDTLREIKQRCPATSVVVLSSEDDPAIIRGAVENGASGFIPKSSTPDTMITALKSVFSGGIYLPSMAFSAVKTDTVQPFVLKPKERELPLDESVLSQLSSRQLEVLVAAIKGKPNKVIARELDIAEGTVKAHLSIAYRVIDVRNRTEAVYLAAKANLSL